MDEFARNFEKDNAADRVVPAKLDSLHTGRSSRKRYTDDRCVVGKQVDDPLGGHHGWHNQPHVQSCDTGMVGVGSDIGQFCWSPSCGLVWKAA